ncbi:MAG: sulfotransferase domain-containing protein [Rhodospirillaceae bacterium]
MTSGAATGSSALQGIALLSSYPKSGSTWVRLFLSAAAAVLEKRDGFDINRRPFSVPFASDRKLILDETGIDTTELSLAEGAMAQCIALTGITAAPRYGSVGAVMKTHDRLVVGSDGLPVFNAQNCRAVVFLVRNPLDIVASMAHHLGVGLDQAVANLCDENFSMVPGPDQGPHAQLPFALGSWATHAKSWLDADLPKRVMLRYEDLLAKPLHSFMTLSRALGFALSEQDCAKAIAFTGFEALQSQEQRDGFVERPAHLQQFFRQGKAGGWKTELTPEHINRVLERCAGQMRRVGYDPALSPGDHSALHRATIEDR